ncbi:protein POLLENLESS 3-LIKE 2-like [Zingiber officinale]|nr:protein POLLENLESS 3-LIKE 2-like [Zingiber officinale]
MSIVMKQQNRSVAPAAVIRPGAGVAVPHTVGLVQEVREIGRLNRAPDSPEAQASTDPEGARLQQKRTKMARSKGRKFQVTLEQEATRLLGNLGWALMQKEKYAEAAYRRAIQIGANRNKMCNLGICLTKQERIAEAKDTLKRARQVAADVDSLRSVDALLKAFERAQEMLRDLELKL